MKSYYKLEDTTPPDFFIIQPWNLESRGVMVDQKERVNHSILHCGIALYACVRGVASGAVSHRSSGATRGHGSGPGAAADKFFSLADDNCCPSTHVPMDRPPEHIIAFSLQMQWPTGLPDHCLDIHGNWLDITSPRHALSMSPLGDLWETPPPMKMPNALADDHTAPEMQRCDRSETIAFASSQ